MFGGVSSRGGSIQWLFGARLNKECIRVLPLLVITAVYTEPYTFVLQTILHVLVLGPVSHNYIPPLATILAVSEFLTETERLKKSTLDT